MHQSRTAQIWRAGGMIWLISITLFFAMLDLYFAKLALAFSLGIGMVILAITGTLFARIIITLRLAKKLPVEEQGELTGSGLYMRKWFLIILALEIAGLNIATFALLASGHFQYIVPVDILIVALHFIPLGRVFGMPVYYFYGIVISLIAILTMLFVPASALTGNLITLAAIPGICFILINWVVIIYILRDGVQYLKRI
jgi:hypothetical protein